MDERGILLDYLRRYRLTLELKCQHLVAEQLDAEQPDAERCRRRPCRCSGW